MVQDLLDLCDVRNQAHLATAHRAQQRKHLVNAGNQHHSQIVRWALGQHRLGRLGRGWKHAKRRCNLRCTHPRSGLPDLRPIRQRRWVRGGSTTAAIRSISSRGVNLSSSAFTPRLSLVGLLRCLAQRYPGLHPLCAAAPGQRGRVIRCRPRHRPRSRCAGRPACLLAPQLSSRPRPKKARRMRRRKSTCTCATAAASMELAGWKTTLCAVACTSQSASPSSATESNTPSTTQTWKCSCWFRPIALPVELAGTGRHWRVHARSQSVRQSFGRAACAWGDAGCRVWFWSPLARPRVDASALG